MSELTDAEVRAELERIDDPEQTLIWLFLTTKLRDRSAVRLATKKALRLLAESQRVLGRIVTLIEARDDDPSCIQAVLKIARAARKGTYKLDPKVADEIDEMYPKKYKGGSNGTKTVQR